MSTHIEIHRGMAGRNCSKFLTGFRETVILLLGVFSSISPHHLFFFFFFGSKNFYYWPEFLFLTV